MVDKKSRNNQGSNFCNILKLKKFFGDSGRLCVDVGLVTALTLSLITQVNNFVNTGNFHPSNNTKKSELNVQEINPQTQPEIFFLKDSRDGKYDLNYLRTTEEDGSIRIRFKSGTKAGYQDLLVNGNKTILYDGDKLVAEAVVGAEEKDAKGNWQDLAKPLLEPSPTLSPIISPTSSASPSPEPSTSSEASPSPELSPFLSPDTSSAIPPSIAPFLSPSASPQALLRGLIHFAHAQGLVSPSPSPTINTPNNIDTINTIANETSNSIEVNTNTVLPSNDELNINVDLSMQGKGAKKHLENKQTFSLEGDNKTTKRLYWEIKLKDFDIEKDSNSVIARSGSDVAIFPDGSPRPDGARDDKRRGYSSTIVDVSDYNGAIRWQDIAATDTIRIYFDEEGTKKDITIDPILTVTQPVNQIVVDDGTRKWVFDSTGSVQAPNLFFHTSVGAGADNLASTNASMKAIGPIFDTSGTLISTSQTLVENTPTRVKIRVQGTYGTSPTNIDNIYTIYPSGQTFLSYNATTVGATNAEVVQQYLTATPQTQNHDDTNQAFVQSDTTNNNYPGMTVVPYTTAEFGGAAGWTASNIAGSDYTALIKSVSAGTYTGNMVIDFSNYRATTTTRNAERDDYRTPAALANFTKGSAGVPAYSQGEGTYNITADANGDSGFDFQWGAKTRYNPAFKITGATRPEDVYQVAWGGAVKTKGIDYNLSKPDVGTVVLQILSNIGANITLTVNSGTTANNIWTNATADGKWSTDGNWSAGHKPTASENVVFGPTKTDNCSIDAIAVASSVTLASGYSGTVTANAGLTISGDFSLEQGAFNANSQALNIGGSFSRVGGIFTSGSNTTTFTAISTGKIIRSGGQSFNIVNFNGVGGSWIMQDALTTTGGAATCDVTNGMLDINGKSFTCGGAFAVAAGGTFRWNGDETITIPALIAGSTVEYSATSGSRAIKSWSYSNLKINGSGGTFTLPGALVLPGNFTLTAGTFSPVANTMTVTGNVNLAGGTFTAGTSTLIMDGAAKTLVGGGKTLYNLQISGTVSEITSDVLIGGTLSIDNTKTYTIDTGRTVTMNAGSTTTINGTINAVTTGLLKLVDTAGANLSTTGTLSANVQFNTATVNVVVPQRTYGGAFTFVNGTSSNCFATLGTAGGQTLTFSSTFIVSTTGTGSLTVKADTWNPTINITGDLTMTKSSTGVPSISMGSGAWTVSGSMDARNGTITAGTSSLLMNSTTAKNFYSNGQTWNNLEFNGAAGVWTLQDDLSTTGYFKTTLGTVTATNRTLNTAGDFNHAGGTFTSTGSTVNLTGGNGSIQQVLGSTTFNNLSATTTFYGSSRTVKFQNGQTQTISGSLTFLGTLLGTLYLASDSPGNLWNITPNGSRSVYLVDVIDSNNTVVGTPIVANYSHDSGNNFAWTFLSGTTYTWLGTTNTDYATGTNWDQGSPPGASDSAVIANALNQPVLGAVKSVGIVTINTGSTLDLAGYTLTVAGNLTNNGLLRLKGAEGSIAAVGFGGTSTVEYYGTTGPYTIQNWTYQNLKINGAGATFNIPGNLTVNGNLDITTGTLGLGAARTLTLGGNYTNAGILSAGTSTLFFNSANAGLTLAGVMTGGSAFYQAKFDGGGSWTINNSATVSAANLANTVVINNSTVTFGDGANSMNFENYGGMQIATTQGQTGTFQTAAVPNGQTVTVDENNNATLPSCPNCIIAVGQSVVDSGQGNLKIRKNAVLRLNPRSVATVSDTGIQVEKTGYLEIQGSQDATGTSNGTTNETTITDSTKAWGVNEHQNKVVRITNSSSLAFGKIYDITANDATSFIRADNSSADSTITSVTGTGPNRTICSGSNAMITADNEGIGRNLHDQTGSAGYLKVVDSVNDDINCAGNDSFITIAEPDAFSIMSDGDTVDISDAVRQNDTYEILDYASVTAENGTTCDATINQTGEAYIYAKAGSETVIRYADICNMGRNAAYKYGVSFYGVDGNNANEGVTVDKSRVWNGYYGIYLSASTNNNQTNSKGITNSQISGNTSNGIDLESGSSSNTLSSNNIYSNSYGILIQSSSRSTVSSNTVYNNLTHGVYLNTGSNNIVSYNNIYGNSGSTGLLFAASSNNIISSNNVFGSNKYGIYFSYVSYDNILLSNNSYNNNIINFWLDSNSNNNTFLSNNAYGNTLYGIQLKASSNNTLISNQFYSNSSYGLRLAGNNSAGNISINDRYGSLGANVGADINDLGTVGTGVHNLAMYNSTSVSPTEVSGVSVAGAYVISRKHDGTAGSTKVWGDYSVPDDNPETPQNEALDQFNYADNSWPNSFTIHGYAAGAGAGTEDTNLDYGISGSFGGAASVYSYYITCNNATCGVGDGAVWDVYRNGILLAAKATKGTTYTDNANDGGSAPHIQFKIDGGDPVEYTRGATYTFVAWKSSNDANTQKSVTMQQVGDSMTAGAGTSLQFTGIAGHLTNLTGIDNWLINLANPTAATASYVNVSNSTNAGASFCAPSSTDSGNNTGWQITPCASCTASCGSTVGDKIPSPSPSVSASPSPESSPDSITYYSQNADNNSSSDNFSIPQDSSTFATGKSVTFDASDLNVGFEITRYEWDFGDGETSNQSKVNHRFKKPGRYIVTLTVFDKEGNKKTFTQTVDIKPTSPTITNIKAKGTDLFIEGKSDPDTLVYFTIHSEIFNGQGIADKRGYWTYNLANAGDTLSQGDHTIFSSAAVKLSDNSEIRGEQSKTYDFKMSVDNGKLKVEMKKARTWQYISLGLVVAIIVGFVLNRVRRRR